MRPPSPIPFFGLAALLAALVALGPLGCSSSDEQAQDDGYGFASDDPIALSYKRNPSADGGIPSREQGIGGASGQGSGDTGSVDTSGEAGRAIEEADLVQVQGQRLYALSKYSGLSVIDIAQRDRLQLLGRYDMQASPIEMVVRGEVVLAMFSSYPVYTMDQATHEGKWLSTGRIVALNTSTPANIELVGSYDIPGVIAESRLIGDVFYVVSHQDLNCWKCATQPNTTILSLNVAVPQAISQVSKLTYTNTQAPPGTSDNRPVVSFTQDRMYVASTEWQMGSYWDHSTIKVIDISAPSGALVQGTSFEVRGQIKNRWQMDEYQSIFRVISQPGYSSTGQPPSLETFRVHSAQSIEPLAQLKITLPRPELLYSVRFDQDRAYASTVQRQDPLFTFDLTDPQHPQQVGALEIPGWLYHIEPRGNRLLALGLIDPTNYKRKLEVSSFDVSDLASPRLLAQVDFGSLPEMPEDQNHVHKAMQVLDAQNLILIPFTDKGSSNRCASRQSGVQLIDFTADTLTLRGLAVQKGESRRAFYYDQRLFAVSDRSVDTFDIENRDEPQSKASVSLIDETTRSVLAGDYLVKLEADMWSGAKRLTIVPASNPEQSTPLGSLDLRSINARDEFGSCTSYSSIAKRSQLFANGALVYLVWPDKTIYDEDYAKRPRIAVFDIADPTAPRLLSSTVLDIPETYYQEGDYGNKPLLVTGKPILQKESTLVFWNLTYPKNQPSGPFTTKLYLVDLSNPAAPVLSEAV